MKIDWLEDRCELPPGLRACATLGADGFDLGGQRTPEGKLTAEVLARREQLRLTLGLERIAFLEQVHGVEVYEAVAAPELTPPVADAVTSRLPAVACAVLTADCLPVLFWSRRGDRVAAAHGGWRGLAAGVLEATLERMQVEPAEVGAFLGAAIGPASFEVGPEVRAAFLADLPSEAAAAAVADAFARGRGDRWFADLYALARLRLQWAGVATVQGGGEDSYRDAERWFSYRRDGARAGRQATLIWIEAGLSRSW